MPGCVVTVHGRASSWYSCRWKNIHRAIGMSGMPFFKGGEPRMLQAACPPACLCVAHIVALAPQHGTQQGAPTALSTRGKQSRVPAKKIYITQHNSALANPLHVMGTVDRTQSQGHENTTYPAHSRLWEHCFPQLPRHLGEEARLPPFTLQGQKINA